MAAPIVFFDIAGPDSKILNNFYSELFAWDIKEGGSVAVPIASPTETPPSLMGTLRQDSAEKMIYIGVEDITAKLTAIVEKGGEIDKLGLRCPVL